MASARRDPAHDRRGGEIIRFHDARELPVLEENRPQESAAAIGLHGQRKEPLPIFKYDSLKEPTAGIRLLRLMAGDPSTPDVECQLFEAQIRDSKAWRINDTRDGPRELEEPYEALSWSWGTDPQDFRILVRKGASRSRMKASPALVWALKYLRYSDRDRTLWIDAICINQQNVEEKNYQVQLMSQIYSYATGVCIWLGLDDEHSQRAIGFIRDEILQLQHFDMLCADERNSQKWQSLLMLMQRQWFFRRWVVQEIALAKDARIYCGPDTISWKDFSVAVELFVEVETATHRLSEVMKKDPKFYHVPGWFEYVSALGASRLVEATGMIFRYYKPEDQHDMVSRSRPSGGQGSQTTESTDADESNDEEEDSAGSGEQQQRSSSQQATPSAEDNTAATNNEQPVRDPASQYAQHAPGNSQTTSADDGTARGPAGLNTQGQFQGQPQQSSEISTQTSTAPNPGDPTNAQATATAQQDKHDDDDDADDPIAQRRPLLDLEHLVSRLSIFQASEPRDAIYALLAIAEDAFPNARTESPLSLTLAGGTGRRPFLVDYGRAYAHVCWDFIEFCVQAVSDKSRALDIICRPWAPDADSGSSMQFHPKPKSEEAERYLRKIRTMKRRPGWQSFKRYFPRIAKQPAATELQLPSWIPRLQGAPFSMFHQAGMDVMKVGRANADPLVGDPLLRRNYNAAQGQEIDMNIFKMKSRRMYKGHSMFVEGFILDKVAHVADSSQSGNIPAAWLHLGGWDVSRRHKQAGEKRDERDGDIPEPPDAFWRTLVADRGKDGQNPPYYYARACKECVAKGGVASGSVNTADLINNERNSIVAQFCRRVQAVIWNRSLIRTAHRNLGIGSRHAKPGDLVAILYGCSVPVILRRHEKDKEQMMDEDKEEFYAQKAEIIYRAVKKEVSTLKQRKKWKELPEGKIWVRAPQNPTEEDKAKAKVWGKEDVRGWLADYKRIVQEKFSDRGQTLPEVMPAASQGQATTGSTGPADPPPMIAAQTSHLLPITTEADNQSLPAQMTEGDADSSTLAQPHTVESQVAHDPAGSSPPGAVLPEDSPVPLSQLSGTQAAQAFTDARGGTTGRDASSEDEIVVDDTRTSDSSPMDGRTSQEDEALQDADAPLESTSAATSTSNATTNAALAHGQQNEAQAAVSATHEHQPNTNGQASPLQEQVLPTHQSAPQRVQHQPSQVQASQTSNQHVQQQQPQQKRKRNPIRQDKYYYDFLGECYIHGMMDGEAVARKTKWKGKKEVGEEERFIDVIFELR
jgi:hypothetical protein